MQWDSAEVNGYSKRRSERNIQRKGSSAGGFVPSSYKDREEQLAREDAEIIKRVKALKDAPALVERAARHLDKEGTGPDYGGGRGLGTAGTASQAEDISKMTTQRKARSVYGDKEERLARATREGGDGAHRKVDEKKITGERNRAAETSAVRSTSIPAYLPPPAYPRRTMADEASEDDDELPMSTVPDSPPPAALSAVTVRRQASRERLRELRELSRAAATDRVQGATGKDQSAEAAFGELSWASFVSLVLWKNASKSTLVFGAGTFFILASSNMRDLQTSPLTIVANFLLLYTAFNFVLTFSRRHDPSPASTPVTEASVLAAVRVALPFLTATKAVHARLFNGDTTTTLQVALCLWVLALCGSVFTFWDVTRIAFFAAFLLPRVYLAYAHHLQAAGRSVYHRCRQLVLSFPHKRKLAAVCALGGWHWLSLPTKCFLGFVLLVLLRRYQEGHAQQVDAGVNFVKKQARRLSSTHPTSRKPAVRRATLEEID